MKPQTRVLNLHVRMTLERLQISYTLSYWSSCASRVQFSTLDSFARIMFCILCLHLHRQNRTVIKPLRSDICQLREVSMRVRNPTALRARAHNDCT